MGLVCPRCRGHLKSRDTNYDCRDAACNVSIIKRDRPYEVSRQDCRSSKCLDRGGPHRAHTPCGVVLCEDIRLPHAHPHRIWWDVTLTSLLTAAAQAREDGAS